MDLDESDWLYRVSYLANELHMVLSGGQELGEARRQLANKLEIGADQVGAFFVVLDAIRETMSDAATASSKEGRSMGDDAKWYVAIADNLREAAASIRRCGDNLVQDSNGFLSDPAMLDEVASRLLYVVATTGEDEG